MSETENTEELASEEVIETEAEGLAAEETETVELTLEERVEALDAAVLAIGSQAFGTLPPWLAKFKKGKKGEGDAAKKDDK